MATIAYLPHAQPASSDGSLYAGAKAFWFITGTSTPKNTYSDYALTTPNTNPVIADANGIFPVMFLATDQRYRLTLKTSADALIYTQDDVAGPVFTQADIGAALYPQTSAESAAGVVPVNYAYAPMDLRRYGGTGDGSTDNATPIANAVLVALVSGDTIFIAQGSYNFSAFPNLDNTKNITFQGVTGINAGSSKGSRLIYTGTAANVISMQSAQAISFRDLQILHNNASFAGTYFRFGNDGTHGDNAYCTVLDCFIGANSGTGQTHFNLDKTIIFTCERTYFFFGDPSIKGQASGGGSYSNVIRFRDCTWTNSRQIPIRFGGEAWTIEGCTFEPLSTGLAGAFTCAATTNKSKGMVWFGNWFGDVTVAGGTWLSLCGQGIVITGNEFGGEATSTHAIDLSTCNGVSITANNLLTFFVGVDFSDANNVAVSFKNNFLTSVGNVFGSVANAPIGLEFNPNSPQVAVPANCGTTIATQNGWERSANGIIRQWGVSGVVTVGTPLAVTFPKQFPSGLHSITLGVNTPTAAGDTAYITGSSTTGFSVNLATTAAHTATVFWQAVGY